MWRELFKTNHKVTRKLRLPAGGRSFFKLFFKGTEKGGVVPEAHGLRHIAVTHAAVNQLLRPEHALVEHVVPGGKAGVFLDDLRQLRPREVEALGERRHLDVLAELFVDVAKDVASRMMMGMPVAEIDDMAKSALSELGNMIMGNAATLLANNDLKIDITPPTLGMGSTKLSSPNMTTIRVPLVYESGEVRLYFLLKLA